MEVFNAGTLAGLPSSAATNAVSLGRLHELDEVPTCPNAEGQPSAVPRCSVMTRRLRRPGGGCAELAGGGARGSGLRGRLPGLRGRRAGSRALLQEGWTRIGRSLSAHVRFDDPTVSRRHALVYRDDSGARILDDRSLNGSFCNGERVDHAELEDGDEIALGRYWLYFVSLAGEREPGAVEAAVG